MVFLSNLLVDSRPCGGSEALPILEVGVAAGSGGIPGEAFRTLSQLRPHLHCIGATGIMDQPTVYTAP